tara:strand:- start:8182 stop:9081 length:900 start_codon:yes stop_codon:yes gene_type:complete
MRHLGALLSIALFACTSFACTSDAEFDGANGAKADEVAAEDAPVLATSYGYAVSSTMIACSTEAGADECKNDERKTVTATIRGLATVTQDGAKVDASFSACRINVDWDGEKYDDSKYFNSKDTLRTLGELARIEGVFVEGETGPVFASGLSALLLGAELSNPIEEDMPTDEDDARALDHDRDGKPGVSVDAPIGKVYLGARVIFDLPLTFSPGASEDVGAGEEDVGAGEEDVGAGEGGSLSGSLEAAGFDFSIYDDSIPFVNARKKANEALEKIKVVSQDHQVTMLPDFVDCDRVLAEM